MFKKGDKVRIDWEKVMMNGEITPALTTLYQETSQKDDWNRIWTIDRVFETATFGLYKLCGADASFYANELIES